MSERGVSVTIRVAPSLLLVEVVVSENRRPQRGDTIIRSADVAGADGASGKTAQQNLVGITAELLTDSTEVLQAILDCGIHLAPPSVSVLFSADWNVGMLTQR